MLCYEIEPYVDNNCINLKDSKSIENNYGNIKLYKKGGVGVCFNYALKNKKIYCCEDGYNELLFYYNQIDLTEAKSGDIISYHELDEENGLEFTYPNELNVLHFAKIKETNGTLEGTIILSKWGEYDIYKSSIYGVLNFYGNAIVIWRKT